ncbi:transcription termination factor 3, mitochondrial isoform X3 [Vulpes vulpes]|uniref:Transcription termination factor 3, mitochondrial isoform X3 n=1 Tax=Vulpes vulpes TaxID=9627 RepID=A0ABM4YJA1_VULVU|nr:transcription termination factor 3, mitochondrial isoform X3 [Vulpes lagopus]
MSSVTLLWASHHPGLSSLLALITVLRLFTDLLLRELPGCAGNGLCLQRHLNILRNNWAARTKEFHLLVNNASVKRERTLTFFSYPFPLSKGVDLSKIEKHPEAANLLLRLDFEKDIKQILMFLKDLGIEDNQLGTYLTKNYAIFSEDLENLKTRVAYLQSKNFSKAQIAQMVRNAPFLLSFSVERLDNRLGFFQKELELSVKKTRDLVVRLPRLLTGSLEPVKENMKVYRLELGFKHNEIQHMITRVPKMLTANKRKLTETFDYVHNVMSIPHHLIVRFPQVFNTRLFKVKERHLFLTYLGRAQYDPTKPNYISLDKFVSVPDEIFCEEIAKASVQDFEKFLKTL